MTWVTPETSRPRAATSVATSTSILPTRKARSARSREPWPRSPWTAATAKPRKSRSSATRSAALLVRVDRDGLAQEPPRERDDRLGHGRAEQHRLPLDRQHGQDPLDVVEEAEVQHPVGLVQDQRADPVQPQLATLGQVEQATRGTYDELHAAFERLGLRFVGHPAVDRQH